MPGTLGRLRRVSVSAMVTNNNTETVPSQPHVFLIHSPGVKTRVSTPKTVVYRLYTNSVVDDESSQRPKMTWIAPIRNCRETRVTIPMLLPASVRCDGGLLIGLHFSWTVKQV